jgi:hypothetical protein
MQPPNVLQTDSVEIGPLTQRRVLLGASHHLLEDRPPARHAQDRTRFVLVAKPFTPCGVPSAGFGCAAVGSHRSSVPSVQAPKDAWRSVELHASPQHGPAESLGSRRRDSNPRPMLYESIALPLSYVGVPGRTLAPGQAASKYINGLPARSSASAAGPTSAHGDGGAAADGGTAFFGSGEDSGTRRPAASARTP